MAQQLLLNFIIAFVWMFLASDWSAAGLAVGFLIGLALLFLFRRFLGRELYVRKVWACLKLLALFLKELVLSNIAVIREILRPRLNVSPGIFTLRTELTSDWEITMLACLITLTPGTLTLEVSHERDKLYIHAMNIGDAEELEMQIKNTFERAIMEVTRS